MLQTITGLANKTRISGKPPNVFALDLNCAIYHCVHKLQKRQPYKEEIRPHWETQLIEQVIAYIKQLTNVVKPTGTLYIAVDGVAPMAKIKQQRMRRFKSAVQAQEEGRIRAEARNTPYVEQPRWDTNAITPGTKFMAALATALRDYGKTKTKEGAHILVSPADEPGEGEQKIMEYVRQKKPEDVVVYGLDADLIVLSLAGSTLGINMDLFREEVEFNGGGVKEDAHGEEQFLYLHVNLLSKTLFETYGKPDQTLYEFVTDFVALMSFLGNDFVPHGLALKIKDDGIERLLRIYKEKLTTSLLIQNEYNPVTLRDLFTVLAEEEPTHILRAVKKKLTARIGSTASKDPEDQALARYNDQPVVWAADRVLVDELFVPGFEKPQLVLRDDWTSIYDKEALWNTDPRNAARLYLESLAWTLAYYTGNPIDTEWYYPFPHPPRTATVKQVLETQTSIKAPATKRVPLTPIQQLAMVLPQSSFHLLPREYGALQQRHPYAWPTSWSVYSFGRRFLWECEPLIPLVQAGQIRQWIDALYE